MFRKSLILLFFTLMTIIQVVPATVTAQTATGGDAQQPALQEDTTPRPEAALTEDEEIDVDALAEEFGLPARILEPSIESEQLELLLLPLTESQLAGAAEAWQRIVQEQTQDVVDATLRVSGTGGETADLFRERVADLAEQRRHMFENFMIVLSDWQKKGGNVDEIAKYRAYRNSIIIDEIRKADAGTLRQRGLKWLTARDGGIKFAINGAIILASLLALLFVARIVRATARRSIGRLKGLSSLLSNFLAGVFYWLTIVIGLVLVFSVLGIDVTPLFALIGGVSFILAFAMQETIANFFSGLMIMTNKPFDQGDFVDLEGLASGTVKQTSLISTTIATVDNKIVSIPNNRVWNSVITNVSASATRRVDMVFGISYSDNIEHAINLLNELVDAHPMVLKSPEPVICVGELAESSVNILCRPWAANNDYWALYWDMQRLVKERFDAEGISIPFPQQTVHYEKTRPEPVGADKD